MPSSAAISSSVGARCSSVLELGADLLDLARLARTERGTQSSERSSSMIEPLMREIGVRLELDLAAGSKRSIGADEAEQAVADQVGLLDVRGQTAAHAAGDVLDQRRVGEDEPLAAALSPSRL